MISFLSYPNKRPDRDCHAISWKEFRLDLRISFSRRECFEPCHTEKENTHRDWSVGDCFDECLTEMSKNSSDS